MSLESPENRDQSKSLAAKKGSSDEFKAAVVAPEQWPAAHLAAGSPSGLAIKVIGGYIAPDRTLNELAIPAFETSTKPWSMDPTPPIIIRARQQMPMLAARHAQRPPRRDLSSLPNARIGGREIAVR